MTTPSSYIVSLTSIPTRFKTLRRPLQSLLDQKPLPPSRILLYVKEKPPGNSVPPGVEVILVPEDMGPITKVYYTLQEDISKSIKIPDDTVILVCDDDCIKPKAWAARLLAGGGVCDNEVVSFATIVSGGYGFAFRKRTLIGLPAFFKSLPTWSHKIDDDIMTLYCVLNQIRIRKIFRGPVKTVSVDIPVVGPRLIKLKGKDTRVTLRKQFAAYVHSRFSVYFDLRFGNPREHTWAAHPKTFC